jgi:large subunit ribosomal protein L18
MATAKKGVRGTPARPRMVVYRSLKNVYVQAVDDEAGRTLLSLSSLAPAFRSQEVSKKELSKLVGAEFARQCLAKGVTRVVFDRNGRVYQKENRLGVLADAARAAGLEF